ARLVHQRADLREHLLARESAALAILIEHCQAGTSGIALGRKPGGPFAQLGTVRIGGGVSGLGSFDLLTHPRELTLERKAFVVAARRVGLLVVVLSFQAAAARRTRPQLARDVARGIELGTAALDLGGQGGGLRAQSGKL